MRKSLGIYSIIWSCCLSVFNVITFVTPNEIGGANKFSESFWVSYIFITIAFLGQLACAFVAFKAKNLKKFFYNISLLSISYCCLVAMVIVGSVVMAVPVLPEWIAITICVIILAFNVIAIIKATAATDIVNNIDEKIKTQTFFIKNLSVEAQSLMTSTKSDELRAQAKKVYEAFLYSDPMTHIELLEADTQIKKQLIVFADAIRDGDLQLTAETATILVSMLEERNQKCKILKC